MAFVWRLRRLVHLGRKLWSEEMDRSWPPASGQVPPGHRSPSSLSAHTQGRPQPPNLPSLIFSPQLQESLGHRYSLPPPGARDTLSQHMVPCYGSNAGSERVAWLPCYFLVINLSLLLHKNPSPFFIHYFPLSPDLRSRIPVTPQAAGPTMPI